MGNSLLPSQTYLRKLPLLDFTTSLFQDIELSDCRLICAQHLVSTTYSLFHELICLGLKPENISTIGKCYSTDPTAFKEMRGLGIDACPQSLAFDSHRTFDSQYRKYVRSFIKERFNSPNSSFKKIILLDDGGELIAAANRYAQDDNFIGIEQTSSGYHKLKTKKIKFPIINVARSPAKLNHESPIIAKLVVDTLIRRIKTLPLKPKNILIIGNGPIGSEIYDVLKNDFYVSTFDKSSTKSSIRKDEIKEKLNKFDLVIGCTGKPVLGPEDYKFLKKDAILVSASSSDREFGAVYLRKKLPNIYDCHTNALVEGRYLINCGFPINFDSEFRDIDIDELQLTRSLLLASILQAYNHSSSDRIKFIHLDQDIQNEIVQKYYSIFSKDNKI